jgi:hypothetical protein
MTVSDRDGPPGTQARVAVLLGAGASADAGIPTTVAMTDAIIERMGQRDHVRLLDFVRYTLQADSAARSPSNPVDVERLFASVELLIDRFKQPWSPFVSSWSPGLESFSTGPRVRGFDLRSDLRAFQEQMSDLIRMAAGQNRWRTPSGQDIADALAKGLEAALRRARSGDVGGLLDVVRREMLGSLFAVLHIDDPSRVDYLSPLMQLARDQRDLSIATLNYDRSIEEIAQQNGMVCDTGIDTWLKSGSLGWGAGLKLLKLHGSIDWIVEETREGGRLPLRTIKKVNPTEAGSWDEPAVVFGEAGKIRAEGPYLELLLAWSVQLREADRLLIVGYSFRDEHVNEVIARWFNAKEDRKVILVDPRPVLRNDTSFRGYLPRSNERFPGPEIVDRFEQVTGLARDVLGQALAVAQRPVAPSVRPAEGLTSGH